MPLYIKDSSVDDLAEALRVTMGVSTKTDAVRIALQNELQRHQKATPLRDRLAAVREQARQRLGAPVLGADMKSIMDELWRSDSVR
ncbi:MULTISPECIES: type II toxin-antitoxin system VapB family antitoxin [Agrobacterium]|uniref:Type II toxin-antitoxin system VapB family antitoxin n=1 Tax=Agrobacterium larrymoorei TaxID=160699 RepID=A0ABX8TCT9_9HYPH|nr:type II toxin-antitoxin system VapB family antitoxin [Agrobacterium larrymoorei]NSZ10081.1 type II toxin-antitoxin system VapB family antitoxin [Agrobacterium tumefaciens]QYA10810.1 type II toxin-antitoxin system VapB family antitoxin [Agrobacterium larrymoorei]